MKNLTKAVIIGFMSAAFMVPATTTYAQATGLTQAQIQAIIALVRSFGADESVVQNVDDSLNGRTPSIPVIHPVPPPTFCYDFPRNLSVGIGLREAEADALGTILLKEGLYSTSNVNSFTEDIASAVVDFQSKYGIQLTGTVGPITRAKLNSLYGCKVRIPESPRINVVSPNGGETYQTGSDVPIRWQSQNLPAGGEIILIISRRGDGATAAYARGINSTETAFSVSIPFATAVATDYQVSVSYRNGNDTALAQDTSNGTFTITSGNTTNRPPVISGVDAPTTLNVNQQGTWTVKASDPENGALSYSVVWGDEQSTGTNQSSMTASAPAFVQTTSFTHSYASSGTFTPSFYVKDNTGQSTQISVSVRVGDISGQPSITVLSPNGGETWTRGTTQTIKWQDITQSPLPCPTTGACPLFPVQAIRTYDLKLTPFSYEPPCSVGIPCTASPTSVRVPYIIAQRVSGSSYSWSVGTLKDLYDELAPDGPYTVQVCQSGTNTCDSSNSYFKIVSGSSTNHPPKIISSSPFVGNIQVGQAVSFSWSANDMDNDDLSWSVDWGENIPVGSSCSVSRRQTGTGWNYNTNHSWAQAGTYHVKVSVNDCVGGSDSNTFTVQVGDVVTPSSITYKVATDKLTYTPDEKIQITITASNNTAEAKILNWNTGCQVAYAVAFYDSSVGQMCTQALTNVTIAPYSFKTWTLMHDPARYKIPMGQYKLSGRVIGYGEETALITVTSSTQPSITVLSPNGGEIYKAGDTVNIRWNTNNFASLKIWLTLADKYGTTVPGGKLNAANISNSGSYSWAIPNDIVSSGTSGAFRIVASSFDSGPSASDMSDNYFTITAPTSVTDVPPIVNLTVGGYQSTGNHSPTVNLGTVSTVTISWSAPIGTRCNTYGQSSILLSDGTNWHNDNLPYAGTRTFSTSGQKDGLGNPINYASIGVQCWNGGTSESKGVVVNWTPPVTFPQPSITVLSPNTGESFTWGQTVNVRWQTSGISASLGVGAALIGEDGLNYSSLSGSSTIALNSAGSYSWTIPSGTIPGRYKIKLSVSGVSDSSDYYFTIAAAPVSYSSGSGSGSDSGSSGGGSNTSGGTVVPPDSLSFALVATPGDKSGGYSFVSGNGEDWVYDATINLSSPKTITEMKISPATDATETWSTFHSFNYNIVVFDSTNQLNSWYGQNFTIPAGGKTLKLYAQKLSKYFNPNYTLTVTFSDGSSMSAVVQQTI